MKRLLVLFFAFVPTVAFAQNVGATRFVSATPTVDTGAYASGDLIGGKLTFSNALRATVGTGYLISAEIQDKSAVASDLDLVIFASDPSSTTFTDQAAFDPADADLSKVVTIISFGSTSRYAFNDNGVKYVGSIVLPLGKNAAPVSTTLYGALVSRGTPTFAASGDVTVTLGIAQD